VRAISSGGWCCVVAVVDGTTGGLLLLPPPLPVAAEGGIDVDVSIATVLAVLINQEVQ